MAKLAIALLCAAFALVAARQLHQTLPNLTKELEALNKRLTTAAPGKAAILSVLARYDDDEHEGHEDEGHEHHDMYEGYDAPKYYYGPNKVSIKLYEKFRSKMRPQPTNPSTFQFTSELTCHNPVEKHLDAEDGVIGFPIASDRTKLVTVGVCEWTVTLVKESKVNEHATLKGNTNVVCRFTEEAERQCHHVEDVICDGMSVSGQGLVYNFEAEGLQKHEYKAEDAKAAAKVTPAAGKKEEDEVESLDVYLTLINGVINTKKHMKWDNGALQYFFGEPATADTGARDGSAAKKGDPTGEYTFVFKH